MTRRTKTIAITVSVFVAAIAMGIWLRSRSTRGVSRDAAAPATVDVLLAPSSPAASKSAVRSRVRRIPDSAARAKLLAAIREAKQQRAKAPTTDLPGDGSSARSEESEPDPDRDYIQSSVEDIAPLLFQCYEQGRARDPHLAGLIIVDFTIEGEPGVGGLVTQSKIDPNESTLADAAVRECIQESMYAIEIEPPTTGGVVSVRYPFTFGAPD